MTVLIVGADRIKSFTPRLKEWGAEDILHWSARNTRSSQCVIPKKADLVICCTDYLNHNTARQIKKQIKQRCLPAIYCRRSWTEIEEGLSALELNGVTCKDCPTKACCILEEGRKPYN